MNILDIIEERHSVRSFKDEKIDYKLIYLLNKFIDELNKESGLNIQLIVNEPDAFNSLLAKYGKFENANNYIALVGADSEKLGELCGYYGEKLVLYAQSLRLNSCWVVSTYSKNKTKAKIAEGEKLCAVIALGYGNTQGVPHKSKTYDKVVDVKDEVPSWFKDGVEAALLAPTAVNQQKFVFGLNKGKVTLKSKFGFYTGIDLGIVKLHFELGAGVDNFQWKDNDK